MFADVFLMRRCSGLNAIFQGVYTTIPLTEAFVTVSVYELYYPIVFLFLFFPPSCHLKLQACLIHCLLSCYFRSFSALQLLRILLPNE